MTRLILICIALAILLITPLGATSAKCAENNTNFDVSLRQRVAGADEVVRTQHTTESWPAKETAVIVCDMWDAHHCLNAVRRGQELTPRMNELLISAREKGAVIIHAPSSCMKFYADHPARKRAQDVPHADNAPKDIRSWCHWKNPHEEEIGYPIDHSDGGEDDDPQEHLQWRDKLAAMGRNPRSPWVRQTAGIEIEDNDYITDDGVETWSILEKHGVKNVLLVGVHTNMCVLGRPFGLRQLSRNGKNVVLVRDLTDTMYNPAMPPKVSHFTGTDLIVAHIEEHVCPTITSTQLLGGEEFRFRNDKRPHIAIMIGEREYETIRSLPEFAKSHLHADCRVSYVIATEIKSSETAASERDINKDKQVKQDGNHFTNLVALNDADLLMVSVRRRTPPNDQMAAIRAFVASGKPVVGIRTASHAFALRNNAEPPSGHAVWPEFDAEVFGGNYQGHHGNKNSEDVSTYVWNVNSAGELVGKESETTAWLYKTSPLKPGTHVLMMGRVGDRKPHEPVTWNYIHSGGGRAFYTSLGHSDDFKNPEFTKMLRAGIDWALER